jgi:hypothetical protein
LPESNSFEVETTVGERYKSEGTDQIVAELMKAGSEILLYEIHKVVIFGIRSPVLCLFIKWVIQLTV